MPFLGFLLEVMKHQMPLAAVGIASLGVFLLIHRSQERVNASQAETIKLLIEQNERQAIRQDAQTKLFAQITAHCADAMTKEAVALEASNATARAMGTSLIELRRDVDQLIGRRS